MIAADATRTEDLEMVEVKDHAWLPIWQSIKRAMLKDADPFFDGVARCCIEPHITTLTTENAALAARVEALEGDIARLREVVERAQQIIWAGTYVNWHEAARAALAGDPS